ncbi:MAG: hypothetical protein LBJ83_03600 [Oscillospiraceae bacterium]|nr:hypothetical protein [Oscillospiraceae bacterium]
MEKKKIFKRVLSFLIAASLVNMPIVCANVLDEFESSAAKNAIFWSAYSKLLQKQLTRGGGKTALERQNRDLIGPEPHDKLQPFSVFLNKYNLKEEGIPNCTKPCEICESNWRIHLLDAGDSSNRCDDSLCLGCLSLDSATSSEFEPATCPICGAASKKITLSLKQAGASSPSPETMVFDVFLHDDKLILRAPDPDTGSSSYFNLGTPPRPGALLSLDTVIGDTPELLAWRDVPPGRSLKWPYGPGDLGVCPVCGAEGKSLVSWAETAAGLTLGEGATPVYFCAKCARPWLAACPLAAGQSVFSLPGTPCPPPALVHRSPGFGFLVMPAGQEVLEALRLFLPLPWPEQWGKPLPCASRTK